MISAKINKSPHISFFKDYGIYRNDLNQIGIIILLSFLNPFIGFCCSVLLLIGRRAHIYYLCFIFSTSLWISLINSTKIPESDLLNYLSYFNRVPDNTIETNIFYWDENVAKEPIYGVYNLIMYYLTGGNERLFMFITSFIEYSLLFYSLILIYYRNNLPKSYIVCGLFILAFFPQLFTLSLHLVRQILASSIFIYALSLKTLDRKKHWILMFVAILIHTSIIILFLLSLLPWIYKYISLRKLIPILFIFCVFLSLNSWFASISLNIAIIDYGLSRFGNSIEDLTEGVPISIILILIIPCLFICLKTLKYLQKDKTSPLFPYIYIFIFLSVFVLSFSKMPLLQYRSFMLMYPFIPFIIPLLFYGNKHMGKYYCTLVSIVFFFRFLVTYNNNPFKFISWDKILISSIFGYF